MCLQQPPWLLHCLRKNIGRLATSLDPVSMDIMGLFRPLGVDGADQLLLAFIVAPALPFHLEGQAPDQGVEFFVRNAPVIKFF